MIRTSNNSGAEKDASAAAAAGEKPRAANEELAGQLDRYTTAGVVCRAEGERIRCLACGHRCLIGPGHRGVCQVRFNQNGQLRVPFGYVAGLACDPVEKKPFFHVYPGSDAFTFGMLGCDFHCSYCQNWVTSQALHESVQAPFKTISPAQIATAARRSGARLVVSSYNEPLITAEWAMAVFQQARAQDLACAFVSNGHATLEVLDYLRPWLTAYKVDLKSFNEHCYRSLGGQLKHVTQTIQRVHDLGLWLEVVTLLVPGFNDDPAELRDLAQFLAAVSRDIPWHVTAFHPDYHLTEPRPTVVSDLIGAAEIGVAAGLRFVYAGNLPGRVGEWENTRCPRCRATLIKRVGFFVRDYRVSAEGNCPECQTAIPGIWSAENALINPGDSP